MTKEVTTTMVKLAIQQAMKFVLVSGVGWVIDFAFFVLFSSVIGLPVMYSNMLSAVPALSFVFFISVKKIFTAKFSRINLKMKYSIYFIYQIILVTSISFLGNELYGFFILSLSIPTPFIKMLVKIIITPVTMAMNYVFMKTLCERF